MGCYWGRDWDATGTLLGRYWDATVQVHRVRLEGPTRPMTAEISQVGADARGHRPITPDHPTVSHRCPPVTPVFSRLSQIGQWTCEINSLRTPPLWAFQALRQDNIELGGGQGDATLIVSHSMCLLAKYLPSPVGVLNVGVLHLSIEDWGGRSSPSHMTRCSYLRHVCRHDACTHEACWPNQGVERNTARATAPRALCTSPHDQRMK